MNNRDWEYIENRLLDTTGRAMEAHGRLRTVGFLNEAARLMEATKRYNDELRAIRADVRRRIDR